MGVFGKCQGGGRRTAPRQAAPLVVVITTLRDSHSAILIDLSQTGVRIRGDNLPDEGAELVVSVEALRSFGTIAWKSDGECGIAFDMPLPADVVDTIRHKAAKGARLSPELWAAYEDWNGGIAR